MPKSAKRKDWNTGNRPGSPVLPRSKTTKEELIILSDLFQRANWTEMETAIRAELVLSARKCRPPCPFLLCIWYHIPSLESFPIFNSCVGGSMSLRAEEIHHEHYQVILLGSNDSQTQTPMLNQCFHCNMCSWVYKENPKYLNQEKTLLKYILLKQT